jgi:hypothetical protein
MIEPEPTAKFIEFTAAMSDEPVEQNQADSTGRV